jgi:hypothetical protein
LEALYLIKKTLKLNQQSTLWEDEQVKAFNRLKKIKERFNAIVTEINLVEKPKTNESKNSGAENSLSNYIVKKQVDTALHAKLMNLKGVEKQLKILGVLTTNLFKQNNLMLDNTNLINKVDLLKKLVNTPIGTNPILAELLENIDNKQNKTTKIELIKPNT